MNFLKVSADSFKNCPSDSIDYAIMENVDDAGIMISCVLMMFMEEVD